MVQSYRKSSPNNSQTIHPIVYTYIYRKILPKNSTHLWHDSIILMSHMIWMRDLSHIWPIYEGFTSHIKESCHIRIHPFPTWLFHIHSYVTWLFDMWRDSFIYRSKLRKMYPNGFQDNAATTSQRRGNGGGPLAGFSPVLLEKSCHIYTFDCVLWHAWMGHVTLTNGGSPLAGVSLGFFERVESHVHVWMRGVKRVNGSCHAFEWRQLLCWLTPGTTRKSRVMGWLRLVGSLKLLVSFAKEPYKRDDNLQNRPMILRSLLIVATPYMYEYIASHAWMSHFTHVEGLCHIFEFVVTYLNLSSHIRECVMSHTWFCCHIFDFVVTYLNLLPHIREFVASHTWICCLTYVNALRHMNNESLHACGGVMSHIWFCCHMFEFVASHA